MTITCSNCQTTLPDTAKFCMNCGAPLGGELHPIVMNSFLKAVANNDLETVEQMIRQDKRLVNIRDNTIEHYTPMHYAASSDDIDEAYDMIELLIAYGADVNAVTEKRLLTPLHMAVSAILRADDKYKTAVVQQLLSYGVDPNAQDVDGRTPLHTAVFAMPSAPGRLGPKQNLIMVLDLGGAKATIADNEGETPFLIGQRLVPTVPEHLSFEERMQRDKEITDGEAYWVAIHLQNMADKEMA